MPPKRPPKPKVSGVRTIVQKLMGTRSFLDDREPLPPISKIVKLMRQHTTQIKSLNIHERHHALSRHVIQGLCPICLSLQDLIFIECGHAFCIPCFLMSNQLCHTCSTLSPSFLYVPSFTTPTSISKWGIQGTRYIVRSIGEVDELFLDRVGKVLLVTRDGRQYKKEKRYAQLYVESGQVLHDGATRR